MRSLLTIQQAGVPPSTPLIQEILEEVRPVILIECFETEKMAAFGTMGYRVYDLQESLNWLAIPKESAEEAE